jgi:hypothetical protein
VELVDPLVSYLGVESGDLIGHKRFLSFFSGGMLPLISLSFLHMLVKFEEEEKKKNKNIEPKIDLVEISKIAGKIEKEEYENLKSENMPTEEEIQKFEEILYNNKLTIDQESEKNNPKRLLYTK